MQTCMKVVGKQQIAPELSGKNRLLPFYFGKSYRNRLRPTPGEYEDIRNLCLKIMGNNPPETSTFFAIGRSPSALAAFLSQCSQVKLEAIPGSLGFNKDRLDPMRRHRLADALSRVELHRKNIVLMDYCLSGATLASFVVLAKELLFQMNLALNLKAVALVHDPLRAELLLPLIQENLVQVYLLEGYQTLRGFLYQESYDRLAEYQPSKGLGFKRNSLIYETYCRNMAECINYDLMMS